MRTTSKNSHGSKRLDMLMCVFAIDFFTLWPIIGIHHGHLKRQDREKS